MAQPKWTEERKLYQREYRQRDPEKWAAYYREYMRRYRAEKRGTLRQAPPGRSKAALRAAKRAQNAVFRQRLLDLLGGRCARCGFSDSRALQIDHVNGGGTKERRAFASTRAFYQHVRKTGGVGYQMLCANCNWIKRHEQQECPLLPRVQGCQPAEHNLL